MLSLYIKEQLEALQHQFFNISSILIVFSQLYILINFNISDIKIAKHSTLITKSNIETKRN